MHTRIFSWVVGAFAVLAIIVSAPGIASAHALKTDGAISVELHIEPNDHPVTGTPTTYRLSFEDKTGAFALPKCDCKVAIMQNNATIASNALAVTNADTSENQYTFAKPGAYTLQVTGTPKMPGAFQSFAVIYDVHVAQNPAATHKIPAITWAGIAIGIAAILAGAYIANRTVLRNKG